MSEKTNKLTVGLIKNGITDFAQIIEDGTTAIDINDLGVFYTEESRPHPPAWIVDFFGDDLGHDIRLLTSSAKGVLIVRIGNGDAQRIFAVLFGHGRHLLQDDVLEERFGLRVVLNSVDASSLRSIDKVSLGAIPKQSREQISREGAASSFGIDIEQDLVSSVTGRSNVDRFGRTISGRDTFSASAKFDASDVKGFLEQVLDLYQDETYKRGFDWIDQIKDIRSQSDISSLDAELVRRFQAGELDRIWMSPPEVIDWADVQGFRYLSKRSPIVPDLDPLGLMEAARERPISLDLLQNGSIHLVSARADETIRQWSVYKCVYAEIEEGDNISILNSGKWYRVASDFSTIVNEDFRSVPDADVIVPDYTHRNEAEYNRAVATALDGSHCLDADMIMHGGGSSSIEFCDVITSDRKIIHVKRYSGSAQLSHLFSQGVVSAELFVADAQFRRKVNDKLPDRLKLSDPDARPHPEDYEVIFAIISKSANPLNLPFFSKVSLRAARQRLAAYGYRVTKLKVRATANEQHDDRDAYEPA